MNYLILFVTVIGSIEILIRSDYFFLLRKLIFLNKKAFRIISNKKYSDHWKEKIITKFSIELMKLSFRMLFILMNILFLFLLNGLIFNDFINLFLSIKGILISLFYGFTFIYLRNLLK